jgi:hypothetical protein
MPKKQSLKIPRDKLIIERLTDGTEFIMLDGLTSEFRFVGPQFHFCLLTTHPDELPCCGYIVPFQATESRKALIRELERRACEGFPMEAVEVPPWPLKTPAIQIRIDAKIKDGDFQKSGGVSIACGVLRNYDRPPSFRHGGWQSWRLLNGPWVSDLWRWTGSGLTLLPEWAMKEDEGESIFCKLKDFDVVTETEEKTLLLATICLLFNHWERRKRSLDHRAAHLAALRFGFKIEKGSLSNWTAEAGCTPRSKSLILRELQALQKRAYQHFEHDSEGYIEWTKKKWKFRTYVVLNPKDDVRGRSEQNAEIEAHHERKLGISPLVRGGPRISPSSFQAGHVLRAWETVVEIRVIE